MSYTGQRRDIPRPLRRAILARPCWQCGAPAVRVEHIKPWIECTREGLDPDDPANLAPTCAPCAEAKDREDARRGRARRTRRRPPEPHPGLT